MHRRCTPPGTWRRRPQPWRSDGAVPSWRRRWSEVGSSWEPPVKCFDFGNAQPGGLPPQANSGSLRPRPLQRPHMHRLHPEFIPRACQDVVLSDETGVPTRAMGMRDSMTALIGGVGKTIAAQSPAEHFTRPLRSPVHRSRRHRRAQVGRWCAGRTARWPSPRSRRPARR